MTRDRISRSSASRGDLRRCALCGFFPPRTAALASPPLLPLFFFSAWDALGHISAKKAANETASFLV